MMRIWYALDCDFWFIGCKKISILALETNMRSH